MPEEQATLHYERRPGFEPARAGNERLMKASRTYEVAPAGEGAAGLEEYLVETKDGEVAGKVVALVDRDGERFLLFDSGTPPIAKERRAARWDDIADIDHDTLAITLRTDLEKTLDVEPANEVEGEKADAVRVTDLPRELMPRVSPERGPTDRPTYAGGIVLFALGLIGLLALALAASTTAFTWEFALFAIPTFLFAAAGIVVYRSWREPYEHELLPLYGRLIAIRETGS